MMEIKGENLNQKHFKNNIEKCKNYRWHSLLQELLQLTNEI